MCYTLENIDLPNLTHCARRGLMYEMNGHKYEKSKTDDFDIEKVSFIAKMIHTCIYLTMHISL